LNALKCLFAACSALRAERSGRPGSPSWCSRQRPSQQYLSAVTAATTRRPARPCRGGRICTIYSTASFVYWPIALVLAYVAIAAFYIRRSRARGVGMRVRPYVIAGIIVAALAAGVSLWWVHNPPTSQYGQLLGMGVLGRLISPGLPSGSRCWCWPGRNATAPCSS
jgi:hypothetical protein